MTEEIKTKIEETKTNAKEKVTNFMLRHEKLFYGVAAVGAIFGIGYSVGRAKTKGVVRKELREEIGHWKWVIGNVPDTDENVGGMVDSKEWADTDGPTAEEITIAP